jgi:hypothetical protein
MAWSKEDQKKYWPEYYAAMKYLATHNGVSA